MTDTTGMVNIGNEGGYSRFFDIRTDGNQNEFEATTLVTQDYVPVMRQAEFEKMNGKDGWTKGRTMRKIASIPVLAMHIAKDNGIDLDDKNELRRFILDHPEWMTVKKLKNDSPSNIIIK